jgi:hypothetical protein
MNNILSRLSALESMPTGNGMQIGQLAVGAHTLIAVGAGYDQGGGIWLDGNPLLTTLPPGPGISIAVLSNTLSVKMQKTYDTTSSPQQSYQLGSEMSGGIAAGDIVVGVTNGNYLAQLDPGARQFLGSVGAYSVVRQPAQGSVQGAVQSAAFIGVSPDPVVIFDIDFAYDYFVSVLLGFQGHHPTPQLAGLPVAWGIYNTTLKTFLLGGGANGPLLAPIITPLVSQLLQQGGAQGGGGLKLGGLRPNIYLKPGILKLDPSTPVTDIPGIGAQDAITLKQNGIENLGQLGASDSANIGQLLNIAPGAATSFIATANAFKNA